MKITIYGTECCSKCNKVVEIVEEVVEENDLDAEVEKIDDSVKAAQKGIMSLPALAVDGEIKAKGKVSTKEEIEEYLNV